MKKIMFNDRYGLTEAVLEGRKTMTRRIIPQEFFTLTWDTRDDTLVYENDFGDFIDIRKSIYARYRVGEVVAVAQSYKSIFEEDCRRIKEGKPMFNITVENACDKPSWTNKMFVEPDLMPHRIRITKVRIEQLQDISDEDCIKEGAREICVNNDWGNSASHWEFQVPYEDKLGRTKLLRGATPQEVYASLMDRISGNGTWESNPYVFVYDFELYGGI